jgi:acetate kinase
MAGILTVNAGSTSVRLGLFEGGAVVAVEKLDAREGDEAAALARFLGEHRGAPPSAAVHRVVHAGPRFRATCAFDGRVRAEIERHAPLAPLHNPPTLAWEAACRARLGGGVASVAVFDSGFFADLPAAAATYALPRKLVDAHGLRRLGFHGLAHQSMIEAHARLRPAAASRVISFQLGGGCSVAAVRDGRPIDTSMGFSPLEGLVMATRPGDVDPGLLLHLLDAGDLDAAALRTLLNEGCGLAGLSGGAGGVRELLASPAPEARLALEVYAYRARKYLGAYLAALGGCDAVLFGGGAGEGSAELRAMIVAGLEPLGVALDAGANRDPGGNGRISAAGSPIEVWVMRTDEESILAREGAAWLATAPAQ